MNYTNTCDFELTANYMALLACILNPKLSIGKAIKCITLDNSKDAEVGEYRKVKPKQNHNYKVKVLDEFENKEIEFDNLSDCCEFLNMRRADITTYIKHNRLFRKRYRIRALEPIRSVERKPVIVTDTLQNNVVEFESVNKACKHLKANRDNINKAIVAKRLFRKRYKIGYKVGNEKHE